MLFTMLLVLTLEPKLQSCLSVFILRKRILQLIGLPSSFLMKGLKCISQHGYLQSPKFSHLKLSPKPNFDSLTFQFVKIFHFLQLSGGPNPFQLPAILSFLFLLDLKKTLGPTTPASPGSRKDRNFREKKTFPLHVFVIHEYHILSFLCPSS